MSGRVDTSPQAVADVGTEFREAAARLDGAPADARLWHGRAVGLSLRLVAACDLIDALAAELAAERAERKAERLASLEEIVREHGMNVDDELVDSCADSTVYRAMLDLADAGRMTIEPGGVGRRIYGRWVAS